MLIIAALYEEVAGLLRLWRLAQRYAPAGMLAYSGTPGGTHAVAIVLSGTGPERARAAATWAIAEFGPGPVIATGFAGACASLLAAGDLVVPSEVGALNDASGASGPPSAGPVLQPDRDFAEFVRAAATARSLTVHTGLLLSSPGVVKDPAQKEALGESTGAIAVDMETYAVAGAAQAAGCCFVAVRAVSDRHRSRLPSFVGQVTEPRSRWRAAGVARRLLTHPGDVPAALRLGAGAAKASKALAVVLPDVVRGVGDDEQPNMTAP